MNLTREAVAALVTAYTATSLPDTNDLTVGQDAGPAAADVVERGAAVRDPRPVWRLPFRCQCGEPETFRYVLRDEQDFRDSKPVKHPRGSDRHTTWR